MNLTQLARKKLAASAFRSWVVVLCALLVPDLPWARPSSCVAPIATSNRDRAGELLRTVGLADKLHVLPRQLSAGQQQRVVVARVLFNQPEILLADKPTSDLDERTKQEIMHLFQAIHAGTRVTILMVTHITELVT